MCTKLDIYAFILKLQWREQEHKQITFDQVALTNNYGLQLRLQEERIYMDIVEQICLVMILSMLLTQVSYCVKLLPSLRKFDSRHHDMINRYGTSVSLMATGVLHVSQSLSQFNNSHLIYDQINTKGVTGTAYSSRSPTFTRGLCCFSFLCNDLKTIVCLYIF